MGESFVVMDGVLPSDQVDVSVDESFGVFLYGLDLYGDALLFQGFCHDAQDVLVDRASIGRFEQSSDVRQRCEFAAPMGTHCKARPQNSADRLGGF